MRNICPIPSIGRRWRIDREDENTNEKALEKIVQPSLARLIQEQQHFSALTAYAVG